MEPKMKAQTETHSTTETQTETGPGDHTLLPAGLTRIVLTGFMGAGKTTIGRLLAQHLGWNFLDLDAHLESRTGLSVPEIFARHGETHFRRCESTALANALAGRHSVLALGGGVIESLTNRLLLEQTPHTLVIFLDAPFPVLYDRCMLQSLNVTAPGQVRPVLADPAEAEARFRARHPLYSRLARLTVDTTALPPAAAVDDLLARLQSLQ
jgi:shikimate kinase